MQRVIRRTTLARNQAKRKARIQEKEERKLDVKEYKRSLQQTESTKSTTARNARLMRKDDWLRGPLAPKRDSGLEAARYGAIAAADMHLPKIPKHLRREYINIAKGDRVCLLKGPDKGKICVVESVDIESESVTVKDHNMADVHVPEWVQKTYGMDTEFMPMPVPISIDDVRLVVTLEENGKPYEAIAKHVYGGLPRLERTNANTPEHTRYIAGEDIPIPWPHEDDVDKPKESEVDTLRQEVEHETWTPFLGFAPFESSIMDELRNKYSKYRMRHDPEWVDAKTLEDLKQEYLQSRTLLTPRGELKLQRAAQKAEARKAKLDENGNYIMSEETAHFIANFMRRKGSGRKSAQPQAQVNE